MSGVTSALQSLRNGGVSLRVLHDGRLWAGPRHRLTPEVRRTLAEHRDELVQALRVAPSAGAVDPLLERLRTAPAIDRCPRCGRETLWRDEELDHRDCWHCGVPMVPVALPATLDPEVPATPGHMTDCDCLVCIPVGGTP